MVGYVVTEQHQRRGKIKLRYDLLYSSTCWTKVIKVLAMSLWDCSKEEGRCPFRHSERSQFQLLRVSVLRQQLVPCWTPDLFRCVPLRSFVCAVSKCLS